MKFINAIDGANKNNFDSDITIVSSLSLEIPIIYLNSYLRKDKIKINKHIFGDLEIALSKNNFEDKRHKILILMQWEDLLKGISERSSSKFFIQYNEKNLNLNCNNIINKLSQLLDRNFEIFIFSPMINYNSVFSNKDGYLNKIDKIWFFFLKKLQKIKTKNLKLFDDQRGRFELDTENFFRSNWPLSIKDTDIFCKYLVQTFFKKKENKKLIITDLDDTLWRGTLGEVGYKNVLWDLDERSFKHRYYQKMLLNFYQGGKLLAICSKNEKKDVIKALNRKDILIPFKNWVHIEASWRPKSEMIKNILKKVNLTDDSFIFIDNSKYEINEVKRKFKKSQYLLFPENNKNFKNFSHSLNSSFIFSESEDEKIRNKSYKVMKKFEKDKHKVKNLTSYLKSIKMSAKVDILKDKNISRPFELINKTNQFNLNGQRLNAVQWNKFFSKNNKIITSELEDKYTTHGTVLVACVKFKKNLVEINSLAMSCRVFSRGLEDAFLEKIIKIGKSKNITFNFRKTEKNKSCQQWINKISKKKGKKFFLNKNYTGKFFGKLN
tara:strand:- start:2191 stop:3840 length:1650 start_codon:yes stop_codon:yes gene_type:complete